MHKVTILTSQNEATLGSLKLAQQLLRCGLATIVQYYPLIIKWKGSSGEEAAAVEANIKPLPPFNNRTLKFNANISRAKVSNILGVVND